MVAERHRRGVPGCGGRGLFGERRQSSGSCEEGVGESLVLQRLQRGKTDTHKNSHGHVVRCKRGWSTNNGSSISSLTLLYRPQEIATAVHINYNSSSTRSNRRVLLGTLLAQVVISPTCSPRRAPPVLLPLLLLLLPLPALLVAVLVMVVSRAVHDDDASDEVNPPHEHTRRWSKQTTSKRRTRCCSTTMDSTRVKHETMSFLQGQGDTVW